MGTCEGCKAFQQRIAQLEAYLNSLGIPPPPMDFSKFGFGSFGPLVLEVPPDPAPAACPPTWKQDTLGHRAPGNLPRQKHVIATPDEKIAMVDCVD